jgi:hypothetical protein
MKGTDTVDYRGDINFNGIPFEIADLMLFYQYFLHGTGVFIISEVNQTIMSDVNYDQKYLTAEDLVVEALVVRGEGDPNIYHQPSPNPARFYFGGAGGRELFLSSEDDLGFVFLEVQGEVTPTITATSDNGLAYHYNGTNTRIYLTKDYLSQSSDAIRSGGLMSFGSEVNILTIAAATVDGRAVTEVMDALSDNDINPDGLPTEFSVSQNYPNPFNPETVIGYSLPTASEVEITVYNITGQRVTTLLSGHKSAGNHEVRWNGRDESGSPVASGVYLYRISAGDFVETRKMLLMK